MIDTAYALQGIAVMALVTFALRALPFVAAQWLEHHPIVHRLGRFLPPAIMLLLVVHSMLGQARDHAGGPWPEMAAVAITAAAPTALASISHIAKPPSRMKSIIVASPPAARRGPRCPR